jgi:hypothetical protein
MKRSVSSSKAVCGVCGYCLSNARQAVCPECGTPRSHVNKAAGSFVAQFARKPFPSRVWLTVVTASRMGVLLCPSGGERGVAKPPRALLPMGLLLHLFVTGAALALGAAAGMALGEWRAGGNAVLLYGVSNLLVLAFDVLLWLILAVSVGAALVHLRGLRRTSCDWVRAGVLLFPTTAAGEGIRRGLYDLAAVLAAWAFHTTWPEYVVWLLCGAAGYLGVLLLWLARARMEKWRILVVTLVSIVAVAIVTGAEFLLWPQWFRWVQGPILRAMHG